MRITTVSTALSRTATAAAACTRSLLQNATAEYVASQRAGHISISSLGSRVNYTENDVPVDIAAGVLSQPLRIDFSRSAGAPTTRRFIGTRMAFGGNGTISAVESVVTDAGDWLFNATGYLYWNARERWDPIPAARRDTYAAVKAAGDAYFDRFASANVSVPFGPACARLEGGLYTDSRGSGDETCNLALPSTVKVTNRRYVVDEEMGTVDIFVGFPGLDRSMGQRPVPDSQFFRVEGGKIRHIHTVSACFNAGCGENGSVPISRIRRPITVTDSRRLW
ncbi:hypothetical protein LQW54_005842 [Pestalotiopsis sp. IQ-011]